MEKAFGWLLSFQLGTQTAFALPLSSSWMSIVFTDSPQHLVVIVALEESGSSCLEIAFSFRQSSGMLAVFRVVTVQNIKGEKLRLLVSQGQNTTYLHDQKK